MQQFQELVEWGIWTTEKSALVVLCGYLPFVYMLDSLLVGVAKYFKAGIPRCRTPILPLKAASIFASFSPPSHPRKAKAIRNGKLSVIAYDVHPWQVLHFKNL